MQRSSRVLLSSSSLTLAARRSYSAVRRSAVGGSAIVVSSEGTHSLRNVRSSLRSNRGWEPYLTPLQRRDLFVRSIRSFSSDDDRKDGADPNNNTKETTIQPDPRLNEQQLKEEFATVLQKTVQAEASKIQDPGAKQEFQEVMDTTMAAVDRLVHPEKSSPESDDAPPSNYFERELAKQDAEDAAEAEKEASEWDDEFDDANEAAALDLLAAGNDPSPQQRSTNIGVPPRPEDPVPTDGRTVQVMFCYSKYEIMEGAVFDDNVGQFHCPLEYSAIAQEAAEFYGEEITADYFRLEYYHNKRWHLLDENCYDVLKYYHEIQTLHKDEFQTLLFLRLPFMYDTSDYPEAEAQDEGNSFLKMAEQYLGKKGDKPKPPPTLADKIAQYLKELKAEKWQRASTHLDPLDPSEDSMQFKLFVPEKLLEENEIYDTPEPVTATTRKYILDRAKTDFDLRDLLLMYPGALEHMVRCLHYDLSWPEETKTARDGNDTEDEEPLGEEEDEYDDEDDEPGEASDHHHEHHHEHGAECKH